MWILVNAVMLNVNALATIRNVKEENKLNAAWNIPKLGEGFAIRTTHWTPFWTLAMHTWRAFWSFPRVFFVPLLLTRRTLRSACCNQAAAGAVLGEQTRLQNLCPLPAATAAWSLHPSSSLQASARTQLSFCSLPVEGCSPSGFGNWSAWRYFNIFISDLPLSHPHFSLIWETGAMRGARKHGDLLGGFDRWVKVPLLWEILWVLDAAEHKKERQGGRRSHCWESRSSFSQQMEKAGGVSSFVHQTAMPCLLMTHF